MAPPKPCRDCINEGIQTMRPAPYPGPRCKTHHLKVTRARRQRAKEQRVSSKYGLTPEQYDALYAAQSGTCYICRRVKGLTKRLCVDHDHHAGCDHDPDVGCLRCVRGLTCNECNDMLGYARDDPEFFRRAMDYLRHPPARRVLQDAIEVARPAAPKGVSRRTPYRPWGAGNNSW